MKSTLIFQTQKKDEHKHRIPPPSMYLKNARELISIRYLVVFFFKYNILFKISPLLLKKESSM